MTGRHQPHVRIAHLLGVAFAWFVDGLQEYGRTMFASAEYLEAYAARRTATPAGDHTTTGQDRS